MWPASLVPGLLAYKNATGIVQMDHVWLCSSKTAEENEENIMKLDVSLNRQNIKWFASTPVTDFRAGRARFHISAEFFQKISFYQSWMTLKCFFSENRLPNRGAHYTWVNTVTEKVWQGIQSQVFRCVKSYQGMLHSLVHDTAERFRHI